MDLRDADRLVDELFHELDRWELPPPAPAQSPRAGVEETGGAYLVEVELPGVPADDLDVTLTGTRLTVRGTPRGRARAGRVRMERRAPARFELALTFPLAVDAAGVRASYADGLLTLLVPKAVRYRARRVPVSHGATRREPDATV